MNKLISCILFLYCSLFSGLLHAGAYVMPISRVGNLVTQKITYWSEEKNAPNPCYGSTTCYIGPDVQYSDHGPGLYGTCIESHNCIEISGLKTALDVENAYRENFGIPFEGSFHIEGGKATCIGLFYLEETPTNDEENGKLWPNSVCGKIPPDNQTCNLSIPSSIDFGTLSSGQISGQEKHITGTIKCTQQANMMLYSFSNQDNNEKVFLNTDQTMWANLKINSKNAFTGVPITVPADSIETPFDFSAVLDTSAKIDAGDYSGVAVVIASLQ